jgi:hypothetical protein
MSMNQVTPQNAPRDPTELSKLTKMLRYRLGLGLNMWNGDASAEEAYLALPEEQQVTELLTALQRYDVQRGSNGQMSLPAPVQPIAPPMQPQQMAPAHMPMPMQPQAPMQMPPQQSMRTPSTSVDPGNSGMTHMSMAQPIPMQVPMPMQPQAPVPMAPPQIPPQQPIAIPAILPVLQDMKNALGIINKKLDDEVPGAGDVEEIREFVMGIARTQQTIGILTIALAENFLGLDRERLGNYVNAEKKNKSAQSMLKMLDDDEGKD